MVKVNNNYNRYILEALEHKITPFIREVKEDAIAIEQKIREEAIKTKAQANTKGVRQFVNKVEQKTRAKIIKIQLAISKLEQEITDLMMVEAKRTRDNDSA